MVLKEFQGFDAFENEAEGTVMTLARLDAWVGTVVSCLMEPEGRGGSGQRRFQEFFARFLPMARHQILSKVREAVVREAPYDMEIRETGEGEDGMSGEDDRQREATIVMRMKSDKLYLATTWKCFPSAWDFVRQLHCKSRSDFSFV